MKRMFDKEEIVEIAKEEGGSVVVDSELSPTSENPVQNKVITEALGDVLPDTTYIILNISYSNFTFDIGLVLPRKESGKYTVDDIKEYLHQNHNTSEKRLVISNSLYPVFKPYNNTVGFYCNAGLFSSDGTTVTLYGWIVNALSFTIREAAISVSMSAGNVGAFSETVTINSIQIQL